MVSPRTSSHTEDVDSPFTVGTGFAKVEHEAIPEGLANAASCDCSVESREGRPDCRSLVACAPAGSTASKIRSPSSMGVHWRIAKIHNPILVTGVNTPASRTHGSVVVLLLERGQT